MCRYDILQRKHCCDYKCDFNNSFSLLVNMTMSPNSGKRNKQKFYNIKNNNVSIYMAHISSLGLLIAPYFILSLVIGHVLHVPFQLPGGGGGGGHTALQPCDASYMLWEVFIRFIWYPHVSWLRIMTNRGFSAVCWFYCSLIHTMCSAVQSQQV